MVGRVVFTAITGSLYGGLCGAIITAGAVIGLGLTSLGFGTRYHSTLGKPRQGGPANSSRSLPIWDKPLVFILVFLTCVAVVGLGIAFFGLLADHHHRRHHEFVHARPPEVTGALYGNDVAGPP